jgi:hypothetical protein
MKYLPQYIEAFLGLVISFLLLQGGSLLMNARDSILMLMAMVCFVAIPVVLYIFAQRIWKGLQK